MCVLTTHVDDFLWASIGTGGTVIDKLLKKFEVSRASLVDYASAESNLRSQARMY